MLAPHTTLAGGNYIIQRHLDSGAMADVYAATDTQRQTQVALKVLRSQLALDPYFEEYFRREASVLLRLQHPNIVRLYELVRDGELLFLVMDFIVGQTLQQYLYMHKLLPTADVLHIAQALAHALDFAHSHQIIHRDIKPSNVLLATNGAILLSDFGVARVAGSTTTAAGPVGTIAYMAPEQIVGGTITATADQYSLAVLIWELLTGRRPFVGDTATLKSTTLGERVMEEHLHHPAPTGLLPPQIDPTLRRALSKLATERYTTCAMLVQQLATASDVEPASGQHWLQKVQAIPQLPDPPAPTPPRPRSKKIITWQKFIIAIGVVAILSTLTFTQFLVGITLTPRNGQGTLEYPDGTTYVGNWINNQPNGQGTVEWPDGNSYNGNWKDNKRDGQGTLTLADGYKYVGKFKDDKFDGQGTLTVANGNKYVGEFKDGKFNGQGTWIIDGTPTTTEYKAGELVLPTPKPTATRVPPTPKPTATRVLPTPRPTSTPPTVIIYEDDFSDPASGWTTGSDAENTADYGAGQININIYNSDMLTITTPRKNFSDVMIETTVDTSGTDSETWFGIVCNYKDPQNLYLAAIKSYGYYSILELKDNQWKWLTGGGAPAYSQRIAVDATSYKLGLLCFQNVLTLWVDGVHIISLTNATSSSGDVGLTAWTEGQSKTKVRFDDFKVFQR